MSKNSFERHNESVRRINDKIYADMEKHFGKGVTDDFRHIEQSIETRNKRISEYRNAKP
jgi:hypothetical protein